MYDEDNSREVDYQEMENVMKVRMHWGVTTTRLLMQKSEKSDDHSF